MEYLGAWGTLIHEKNLKSKISCQTPFKVLTFSEDFFNKQNVQDTKAIPSIFLKKCVPTQISPTGSSLPSHPNWRYRQIT